MGQQILKKPEWFGRIEIPGPGGGSLPSFMYDKAGLPCGFALFTTKPKCDNFLHYKKGLSGKALRLGVDIKITQFQSWSLMCVDSLLQAHKKSMPHEELASLVYMAMPIWINPRRPQISSSPIFENFLAMVQRYYTIEQLSEAQEGGKYIGKSHLRAEGVKDQNGHEPRLTLAVYEMAPPPDTEATETYFGILVPGEVMEESELLSEENGKLVLGVNAHITETHPDKEGPFKEAAAWIEKNVETLTNAPQDIFPKEAESSDE